MTKRPHSHGIFWTLLLAITALALVLRLPDLDKRPMHTDEATNAYICGQILDGQPYHYDPQDRHGPALYLSAIPILRLSGIHALAEMDERSFRLTVALLSSMAVIFFAGMRQPLGDDATLLAALFWAASPLPLFYGRYMIHETGFVAMTLGLVATGWQAVQKQSPRWAAAAGAMAALMLAFKETAIINFAAIGLAFACYFVTPPRIPMRASRLLAMATTCAVAFIFVVLLFFSWGFTDWHGPVDLLRAFVRVQHRAGGEGHQKPFWYFAQLLSDGWGGKIFLVAAALGAGRAWRARGFDRAVVVWLVAVFLMHSFIPYKTPWLALSIWLPLSILAAIFLSPPLRVLLSSAPVAVASLAVDLAVLALVLFLLARDDRKWVYRRAADENNPYVYSHTTEDVQNLPLFIERYWPHHDAVIAVIAEDAWPMPWYLRRFPRVGYWQPGEVPGDADVYITDLAATDKMQTKLEGWRQRYFGIRPNVLFAAWKKDK